MEVHTFIAESAVDAVSQIRAQLGPQAVVLNVRPLPGEGLARLWQKRRIEVLAYAPDNGVANTNRLPESRAESSPNRAMLDSLDTVLEEPGASKPQLFSKYQAYGDQGVNLAGSPRQQSGGGAWRVGSFLETSGLLPLYAQRVVDELRSLHGDVPPPLFGRELDFAGALLRNRWHAPKNDSTVPSGTHVFIGPPGTGKTVCLCKWLARAILVEGRTASVWRLDCRTANTSEALSVYAEILNVPVLRALPANLDQGSSADLLLVDLPGVSSSDAEALGHLAQQIQRLPRPQVHLVLNAAYETSVLLAQARAFQALPLADLVLTHLDEEPRWGKIWNLVLGMNFPISFLSAGQNIPGEWLPARPEEILARQMPEI